MKLTVQKLAVIFCCALALPAFAQADDDVETGPLFSQFPLTLSTGFRREAAGPLFYSQQSESQQQWALPPFFCSTRTPDVDWTESEFLYPILTYRRFGGEYRLQLVELLSFSGGKSFAENGVRQFTIFPFYFQQRAPDTNLDYTAVVPFYGHLKNRLLRDETKFVMFPLYSETRKNDVVTDNYLYPFFDVRRGDHLNGWQFWPVAGVEHKAPTLWTNMLDEVETNGGFDKFFAAWPFFFKGRDGLGTTNGQSNLTVVPFYSHTQSAARDETSYGWPIGYNVIDDRQKNFVEHDFFWPLFVFAHGEKKVTRIFPFYSQAHNTGGGSFSGFSGLFGGPALTNGTNAQPPAKSDLESDFYLWPVYKFNRLETSTVERQRTRIMFFLYSDITETNFESGGRFHRADFWPFYTYRRDLDGGQRWQALALLEPFFPNNRSITREYSQLWSVWRCEKNHKTGASSQSLLWNLYRREETPQSKNFSLFFGLYQYESGAEGRRWRVCHMTVKKKAARPVAPES
jgi:hypothetical protein